MSGGIYDLDTLKRGLKNIEDNIAAFEEGLAKERAKKAEYERQIAIAEAILELHRQDRDGYKE